MNGNERLGGGGWRSFQGKGVSYMREEEGGSQSAWVVDVGCTCYPAVKYIYLPATAV